MLKKSLFAIVLMAMPSVSLAQTTTEDVKISMVSLTQTGAGVNIQTEPRHQLDNCTNDYWLSLSKGASGENYELLLSMVLTAQAADSTVTVVAKGLGGDFCQLDRLIIK